ncbi:MAG: MBOAT family protein [Candidatus Hydrogenedentes bacterium]|nr:MBOAT family protein [Candidatus Hydrogenedentota bacterium]
MLFNSLHFAIFFPIVVVGYFLLPNRVRWIWLLIASYYFYMAWIPIYVLLLIATTTISYISGLLIHKSKAENSRKLLLWGSIIINLGILFIFKYYNFFIDTIEIIYSTLGYQLILPYSKLLLPIGISFYTFQAISYIVDVYRKEVEPEKHLGIFALYVSFFPQLVAGPIERASSLIPQLKKESSFDFERISEGLKIMAWGLFKKVVVADRLGYISSYVFANPQAHEGPGLLLAMFFSSWQIYCDFSGYSDIAVGSAKVLGINLIQNFETPYFSSSFPELWRRWHISLMNWFRDYVFFPLGGSRFGVWQTCRNLLIVFTLSGLWHGANWTYVFWGFLMGLCLIMSLLTRDVRKNLVSTLGITKFPRFHKVSQILMTYSIFLFFGVPFRAEKISDVFYIWSHLWVGWSSPTRGLDFDDFVITLGMPTEQEFNTAVVALGLLILVEACKSSGISLKEKLEQRGILFRWSMYYLFLFLLAFYGVWNSSPFIYFQF